MKKKSRAKVCETSTTVEQETEQCWVLQGREGVVFIAEWMVVIKNEWS